MQVVREARNWLFEQALPFWARAGVDRARGGFVEHMTLDGRDAAPGYKRVRVVARQIYAFSHASLLGFPQGLEIAREGAAFLTEHAWLGADAGWARRLDADGRVIDRTPDLYDLAFVLFALGWYARASGDGAARAWAARTHEFIDARMRQPDGEGFVAELPETGWRQQNPHMHLLEAALVHLEDDADPRWRRLADELVDLFRRRFFDAETGALREFYGPDWAPAPGAAGRRVEPGHQFEWAWILGRYQGLTGVALGAEIGKLVAFAETHGVDRKTRRVYDAVDETGAPIETSSRLWTNCERIQAAVARYEIHGVDPRPVFAESAGALLDYYLLPAKRGAWIDHLTAQGAPMVDKIPASSLYHVMIAFAEMLRIDAELDRPRARRDVARQAARSEPGARAAM